MKLGQYSTTYIDDLIYDGLNAEVSQQNLKTYALVTNLYPKDGDVRTIKIPYLSLTNKYKDFLSSCVVETLLGPEEIVKYRYKPKTLSLDLYKTTELWFAILELNCMKSIVDFHDNNNPDEWILKLYEPKRVLDLINEILILEKRIK